MDQQGDLWQDNNIKQLASRQRNERAYKATATAGCKHSAKDHRLPVHRSRVEHRATTPACTGCCKNSTHVTGYSSSLLELLTPLMDEKNIVCQCLCTVGYIYAQS